MTSDIDKLHLDALEPVVTYLTCSDKTFYDRIGRHLRPAGLADPAAQLAVEAAHAVYADVGHGPTATMVVMQRLTRWHRDGKVKATDISMVSDLFEDVEDSPMPTTEEVVSEVAPMVKATHRIDLVDRLADAAGKGKNLADLAEEIQRTERIGEGARVGGVLVQPDDFDDLMDSEESLLPTGIPELDLGLGGGLPVGCEAVIIGGPSDGKSMMLCHVAGQAVLRGMNVAYATLEMSAKKTKRRIVAHVLGIPMAALKNGTRIKDAAEGWRAIQSQLGRLVIGEFDAGIATAPDISEWVRAQEEVHGCRFPVLIVDYADKLESHKRKQTGSDYNAMEDVYEYLRLLAEREERFLWTASQAQRKKDSTKLLSMYDVADSMHKVRVADIVVTINLNKETGEVTYVIDKNRDGEPAPAVGPIPHNYSCAQMVSQQTQAEMLGLTDFEV